MATVIYPKSSVLLQRTVYGLPASLVETHIASGGPSIFNFSDTLSDYTSSNFLITSSWAHNTVTSSYILTSSFASSSLSSSYALTASYFGSGTTNYLPKWNNNTLTTSSLIIDTGDAIGIGTTPSALAKLDVRINPGVRYVLFDSVGGFGFNGVLVDSLDDNGILIPTVHNASEHYFWNGNVGIGNLSAANKLSVNGAMNIGSAGYNVTGPANGLIVEGNVGIGTTSPQSLLHVNGNIQYSSMTSSLAEISATKSASGKYLPVMVNGSSYYIPLYL